MVDYKLCCGQKIFDMNADVQSVCGSWSCYILCRIQNKFYYAKHGDQCIFFTFCRI